MDKTRVYVAIALVVFFALLSILVIAIQAMYLLHMLLMLIAFIALAEVSRIYCEKSCEIHSATAFGYALLLAFIGLGVILTCFVLDIVALAIPVFFSALAMKNFTPVYRLMTIYICIGTMVALINPQQVLFIFSCCIAVTCDIAGYCFGTIFKDSYKPLPYLSPKKTITGFAGGIVMGTLVGIFLIDSYFYSAYGFASVVYYAFIVSVLSIIGDLMCSFYKRLHGVSDYSSIIPGHGGIMDRMDSIYIVSIFSYIIALCGVFK